MFGPLKIDRRGIGAAEQDSDALIGLGPVFTGEDGSEGSGTAGFGHDSQRVP